MSGRNAATPSARTFGTALLLGALIGVAAHLFGAQHWTSGVIAAVAASACASLLVCYLKADWRSEQ